MYYFSTAAFFYSVNKTSCLFAEIMRISGLISNKVAEFERMGHDYPYKSFSQPPNGGQISLMAWNAMQAEVSGKIHGIPTTFVF